MLELVEINILGGKVVDINMENIGLYCGQTTQRLLRMDMFASMFLLGRRLIANLCPQVGLSII